LFRNKKFPHLGEFLLYLKKFIEYNQDVKQIKEGQMAEKTPKKPVVKKTTATKPAAAKKPVAKKAPAKKAVAKKTPAVKSVAAAPVVEKHACGCEHTCACGGECACAKKKCTFGRFLKKLVLFIIIFALGFATAKMCCCNKRGKMGPRPEFDNGCLVVKCPKLAEMAPMMDADHDGCITPAEFKAARKHMKRGEPQPAQPVEAVEPEMPAPAPQVAE